MSDTVETVTSTAAPVTADTSTASPDSSPSSVAAPDSAVTASPASSSPAGRTYTDADVQRIVRERIDQANKSFSKRQAEYDAKLKNYEQVVARANAGIEGMARGFGFLPEQEKKPWEQDINSIREETRQYQEQAIRRIEEARYYAAIQSDFDRVKQAFPEYVEIDGFKDAFARNWKPGSDPVAAAKPIVDKIDKLIATRTTKMAEEKAAAAKVAPVGKGGGTASSAKPEKGPLRSTLKAALAASRGN